MKFKIVSTVVVLVIMLLATLVYLSTKNRASVEGEVQQTEEVAQ